MAQQTINLGQPGSGAGGDDARTAFVKIMANFGELYPAALPGTAAQKQAARDMFGLGTAATRAVQTGPTDTTANALMAVGAFGLGSVSGGVKPSSDNIDDVSLAVGVSYRYDASTVGTKPSASGSYVVLRINNIGCTQLAFDYSASTVYVRNYAAAWLPWRKLFHEGNIIGTVSQAGGVPTGAIIERGSNASGEYARYADGTQICWRDFAPISVAANAASAVIGWSYPAGFTAAPLMMTCATVNFSQHIDAALALCDNGPVHNQSSTRMILRNLSATARDIGLRVVAIGRWY